MAWGGARTNSGPRTGADGKVLKPYNRKKSPKRSSDAAQKPIAPEAKTAPAEAKAPEQRQPMFSTEAVHMLLQAMQERQVKARNRPRTPDWNPYIIHPEKFGPAANMIAKHKPSLAMDKQITKHQKALARDNAVAVQAWQAGGMIGNAVAEGLLFLGYPYLSELAQRPEFRLFGEIRSEEMTRKWTDLRGTDDESTKEEKKPKQRNKTDEEASDRRAMNGEKPRNDARNKEIESKIKELRDAEKEFKIRAWFKDGLAQGDFFGIGHILIDLKGTNPENMQDPELKKSIGNGRDEISEGKLGKGCLRGLRTIEPIWVYPTTYNAVNPMLDTWYDPQVWYMMGTEIHKSRLLSIIPRPVPDILKPAYMFGGLSMTQMAQPYVEIWLRTRESVGEIIHAFSVMVLKTNLATTTMPAGFGGQAGDVLARVALFNLLRDNQGAFIIDKNTEDFMNVAVPLGTLDALQAQSQEHLCSVARIPVVKYTGIDPKGLNASSEGSMRSFYDTTTGEQNHIVRPGLDVVYDVLQYHLWGARDPDITYDFEPLWESTEKEKSDIRKADAETAQVRIDSGVISQEEERRRLATDPESGYHGLDPDDVPDLLEEEEEGLIPEGAGKGLQAELEEGGKKKPTGKPSGESDDGGIQNFDDEVTPAEARRNALVTGGDQGENLEQREHSVRDARQKRAKRGK